MTGQDYRIRGWDRWTAAVTFAEAGEAGAAEEFLRPADRKRPRKRGSRRREQRSERPVLRT